MKTPEPAISIIMPARNEGMRVSRDIKSFASGRSALFPIEFVIVDDASEDGCCDELENLLTWEHDAVCIHVIRMEHWCGIPYARNEGAAAAHARILFITDANVEACKSWDRPLFRDFRPEKAVDPSFYI